MDPRAPILRRLSEQFADDGEPNFLEIAATAEREAHEQKGLWPNVDLYSGVLYHYLGHPDRPLHPALRDEPRRRPGGTRARAARGRQDHPAERRVRRRAAARLPRPPAPLSTFDDERVQAGLEGVVAFETEIAEPDRDGGSLRYRGVDIEELVGSYRFEQVWGLLVDESFEPGLPVAEPYEGGGLTGNTPADLQSVTARARRRMGPEEADRHLRRRGARGSPPRSRRSSSRSRRSRRGSPTARPIGSTPAVVAQGETTAERFLLEWRGEADPKHVQAIDTYWICTCEHGLNASTFIARIVASTGSDCAAGALVGGRRALRPAARRRARARAADARRRRGVGRPRALRREPDREGRAADGLRPPRLPRRGSARPPAQGHREGARRAALRRRGQARAGRARGAARRSRPTGRSRRTSSSGRRSSSTSPTCRRSSRRRCSPAPARRAGRRTSSSRRSSTGSSGRPRRTSARRPPGFVDRMTLAGGRAAGRRACRRGRREGARDAAAAVGRGARARGAERRLPRPRPGLPRDRAVPLPPEARARPARAPGREPGRARLGADRARGALPRPSGRRQRDAGAAARARVERPEHGRAAARDRLPQERLAAARDDPRS